MQLMPQAEADIPWPKEFTMDEFDELADLVDEAMDEKDGNLDPRDARRLTSLIDKVLPPSNGYLTNAQVLAAHKQKLIGDDEAKRRLGLMPMPEPKLPRGYVATPRDLLLELAAAVNRSHPRLAEHARKLGQ